MGQKKGCDLVAMSTHGHRFLADMFLGTTATRVQHNISVPVLLLRAKWKRWTEKRSDAAAVSIAAVILSGRRASSCGAAAAGKTPQETTARMTP